MEDFKSKVYLESTHSNHYSREEVCKLIIKITHYTPMIPKILFNHSYT